MNLLLLALANLALGAGLLYTTAWPAPLQAGARKILGLLGIVLSLVLMDWGRAGLEWRSVGMGPEESILCGVAIAGSWTLMLLRPAAATDAIVAAAAAPLILVVGADWVVPQLLFSVALFWAIAAAGFQVRTPDREMARPLLALALIAAGAIVMTYGPGGWALPRSVGSPERWLLLAGALVAIIDLPLKQGRDGLGIPGAPLLVAAGFSLLPRLADGAPGQGVVLLTLAVGLTATSARRSGPELAVASVPLLVLTATALLAPPSATAAGLGAVLIATAAGAGRMAGDPFRALLVAVPPLTVGFASVGLAGEEAIGRAAVSGPDQVGWALAAILLLLASASCLWVGIKAGRALVPEPPPQVRATVLVAAAAVLLFVAAEPLTGISPIGPGGGAALLFLTAIGTGLAATAHLARRETATIATAPASHEEEEMGPTQDLSPPPMRTVKVVLVLGGATLGMVGYVTYQGLKVGFL